MVPVKYCFIYFCFRFFTELPKPTCVLCATSSDKVILFKQSTLQKCHEIFKARSGSRSKWSNVKLPSVIDSLSGYHTSCYRNYTAYSCPKPGPSESQEEEQSEATSEATSDDFPPSEGITLIFSRNCSLLINNHYFLK